MNKLILKQNSTRYILALLFFCQLAFAESWNFKLKSKVELRSWKLSSVAMKSATSVNGASIKLYNGTSVVSETVSDPNGNFEIDIPQEGEYILEISYAGSSPKKFAVSTKSTPNGNDPNFKPSVNIVGLMAAKYTSEGKYLGLDQTHVKIDHKGTENGLEGKAAENKFGYNFKLNMYDAEYLHIQRFCTANKLGDIAMSKKNYELAKKFYLIAADRINEESYPKERLKLAEEGLKVEESEKASARKKQGTKTSSKQVIIATPNKNVTAKKSAEGEKPRRKIRQTLGK